LSTSSSQPETPTPSPKVIFYSLTIYYQSYPTNPPKPHIFVDINWLQPINTKILYKGANDDTWHDPTSSYTGNTRIDLSAINIGYNEAFYIEALDQHNNPVTPTYRYFSGYPNPDEQQRYIVGQNGDPGY
jgi:hypothetical protein